jgi:hypothetical protein
MIGRKRLRRRELSIYALDSWHLYIIVLLIVGVEGLRLVTGK